MMGSHQKRSHHRQLDKTARQEGYRPRYSVKQGRLKLLKAMEKFEKEEDGKSLLKASTTSLLEELDMAENAPKSPVSVLAETSDESEDDDYFSRSGRRRRRLQKNRNVGMRKKKQEEEEHASKKHAVYQEDKSSATALFSCGLKEVAVPLEASSAQGEVMTSLEIVGTESLSLENGDFLVRAASGESVTLGITSRGKIVGWGNGLLFKEESTLENKSSVLSIGVRGVEKLKAQRLNEEHIHADQVESMKPAPASLVRQVLSHIEGQARVVACGPRHCCVVTADGSLYSWGLGTFGRLGHGDTESRQIPKRIHLNEKRLYALSVACGTSHTAAIVSNESPTEETGMLYTWGDTRVGQLGHADLWYANTQDQDTLKKVCYTPRRVEFFHQRHALVRHVSCGAHHTLAIAWEAPSTHHTRAVLEEEAVEHDQLFCTTTTTKNKRVKRFFTTRLYAWGFGDEGRLGVGDDTTCAIPTRVLMPLGETGKSAHIVSTAAGDQHSLALVSDGRVYAWGDNSFGQLGGPVSSKATRWPVLISSISKHHVIQICSGARHSGATTDDGRVLLWGFGEEGQLGTHELSSKLSTPPNIHSKRKLVWKADSVALGVRHTIVLCRNETAGVTRSSLAEAFVLASKPKDTDVVLAADSPRPSSPDQAIHDDDDENRLSSQQEEVSPRQADISSVPIMPQRNTFQSLLEETRTRRLRERDALLETRKQSLSHRDEPLEKPSVSVIEDNDSFAEDEADEEVDNDALRLSPKAMTPTTIDDQEEEEQEEKPSMPTQKQARNFNDIFYRDTQDLEKCYVGNAARRARSRELRKKCGLPDTPSKDKVRAVRLSQKKIKPTKNQQDLFSWPTSSEKNDAVSSFMRKAAMHGAYEE